MTVSAVINYLVDPAQLYKGGSYERGIVDLLHQGMNVANISNHDERLLQKYYVEGLNEKFDVLVLGSSRSLQIRSQLFSPASFFNASVSGSSIEDYFAIFALYYKRGFVPDTLVLGIDPWVFNKNNKQSRWRSYRQEYEDMLYMLEIKSQPQGNLIFARFNKLKQLISWGYLRKSLSVVAKQKWRKDDRTLDYYPIESDVAPVGIRRTDGSVHAAGYERRTFSEIRQNAIDFLVTPYSLQDFNEVNEDASHQLELFLAFLEKSKVRTVIFLAPYHPLAYEGLARKQSGRMIGKVEANLREIAENHQVPLMGSYDPVLSGCSEAEFYDGMHPREVCVNRILRPVLR